MLNCRVIGFALALLSSGCLGAFQGATIGTQRTRTPEAEPSVRWIGQPSSTMVPASQVRCYRLEEDPHERKCWRVDGHGAFVESVEKIVVIGA